MYKIGQSGGFQTFIGHKSFSSREILWGPTMYKIEESGGCLDEVGEVGRGNPRIP